MLRFYVTDHDTEVWLAEYMKRPDEPPPARPLCLGYELQVRDPWTLVHAASSGGVLLRECSQILEQGIRVWKRPEINEAHLTLGVCDNRESGVADKPTPLLVDGDAKILPHPGELSWGSGKPEPVGQIRLVPLAASACPS